MEIEIYSPIELKLIVLESEDRLPSIKLLVEATITHPTGTSGYNANDIWIDCSQWDKFTIQLSKLDRSSDEKASLISMSEYFQISIGKHIDAYMFQLTCKEPETGSGSLELRYSKEMNSDEFVTLREKFIEFPKWW